MTTATLTDPTALTGVLDPAAQALIDTRLDTIERMLNGQVPRADRLAIVREVEAQLYDHLAERNPEETDRDAVLAALSRLDPPEAYLPDQMGLAPQLDRPSRDSIHQFRGAALSTTILPITPTIGKAGGIVGLVAIVMVLFGTIGGIFGVLSENELLFFGSLPVIVFAGTIGLLAIIFAGCARVRGSWSLIGLTTGILALMASLGGMGWAISIF